MGLSSVGRLSFAFVLTMSRTVPNLKDFLQHPSLWDRQARSSEQLLWLAQFRRYVGGGAVPARDKVEAQAVHVKLCPVWAPTWVLAAGVPQGKISAWHASKHSYCRGQTMTGALPKVDAPLHLATVENRRCWDGRDVELAGGRCGGGP